jgi:hypothetical protein
VSNILNKISYLGKIKRAKTIAIDQPIDQGTCSPTIQPGSPAMDQPNSSPNNVKKSKLFMKQMSTVALKLKQVNKNIGKM